jgi:hypothetical protein
MEVVMNDMERSIIQINSIAPKNWKELVEALKENQRRLVKMRSMLDAAKKEYWDE